MASFSLHPGLCPQQLSLSAVLVLGLLFPLLLKLKFLQNTSPPLGFVCQEEQEEGAGACLAANRARNVPNVPYPNLGTLRCSFSDTRCQQKNKNDAEEPCARALT